MGIISGNTPNITIEPTPCGRLIPGWLREDLTKNLSLDKLIIYPSEKARKANLEMLSKYISSIDSSKHLTINRLFSSLFLDLRLPNVMDDDSLLFTLVHQKMAHYAANGRFPFMFTAIEGRKWSEYKTERLLQLHKELSDLKPTWKWDDDPGVKDFRKLLLEIEKLTKKTHPHLMKAHLFDKLESISEIPFTLKDLSGIIILDHCPEFCEMDRELLTLISKITPIHQLCSPGSFRLGFHGAYIEDIPWCTEETLPKWLTSHEISIEANKSEWISNVGVVRDTKWHRISLERKDHNISASIELIYDFFTNQEGNIIVVDAAADKNRQFWSRRLNDLGVLCNLQSNNLREQSSITGLTNALNMGEGLESWSFDKFRRLIENTTFPLELNFLSELIHPMHADWKPIPHLEVLQNISLNFHVLGGPGALERWIYTLSIAKPSLGSDLELMEQRLEETQWWLANILKIWSPLCSEAHELSKKDFIGCSSGKQLPLIDPNGDGTEWLNMILHSVNLSKLSLHEASYSRSIPSIQILYEEHHRILEELNQLNLNLPLTSGDFIKHILRIIEKTKLPAQRSESRNLVIITPEEAFGLEAELVILAGLDAESWSMKAPKVPWLDTESRLKLGILNQDIEVRKGRHQLKYLLNASKAVIILDSSEDESAGPCAPLAEFLQYQKNSGKFNLMSEIPNFIQPENYDVNNPDRPWTLSSSESGVNQGWLSPRTFSMVMTEQGAIGNRSGKRGRDHIQRAGLRLSNNQGINIAPISISNLAKSNELSIFNDRLKRQPSHKNLQRGEFLPWESRDFMVSVDSLTLKPSKSQAETNTIDVKVWPHLGVKSAKSNSPAIDPRPLPAFQSGSEIFQSVTGKTSQKISRNYWSASRIQSWLRCPRGAWLEKHLLANQIEESSEDIDSRTRGLLIHDIQAFILEEHGLNIEGPAIISSTPMIEGKLNTIEKLWEKSLEFIEQNAPWLSRKNAVSHHRCRDMLGINSYIWQQYLESKIKLEPKGRVGRMLEAELLLENSSPIACEWNLNSVKGGSVIKTTLTDKVDISFKLSGRIDRVDIVSIPSEIKKQAIIDGAIDEGHRWVIIRDLKNIEGPKVDKQGSRHRTAIFEEVQLALYAKAWELANPKDRVVGVGISEVGEVTRHFVELDSSVSKYFDDIKIGIITNYTSNHFRFPNDTKTIPNIGFRAWMDERITTSARAIHSAQQGNFHPTPCKQCFYCKSSGLSPSAELGGGQ